jgi:hypothetical protein
MRGVTAAVLTIFIATPAVAGRFHDRIPLPPAAPAYETSDGDPYRRFARDYGPPGRVTDLQRMADSIGAGRNQGHADFFRYSIARGEYDNKSNTGAAFAGTFSNGAAELQLRWNTGN